LIRDVKLAIRFIRQNSKETEWHEGQGSGSWEKEVPICNLVLLPLPSFLFHPFASLPFLPFLYVPLLPGIPTPNLARESGATLWVSSGSIR